MPKPIQDNLRNVSVEDENGDLRPLLDVAGEKLAEVINAVVANNKAGTLTLKVDIKPSTAGAPAIKAGVNIKKPLGLPPESLLWPTADGNLLAEDPRQQKLELKAVQAEKTTLKTVAAA